MSPTPQVYEIIEFSKGSTLQWSGVNMRLFRAGGAFAAACGPHSWTGEVGLYMLRLPYRAQCTLIRWRTGTWLTARIHAIWSQTV
jgi:hypothetical protein